MRRVNRFLFITGAVALLGVGTALWAFLCREEPSSSQAFPQVTRITVEKREHLLTLFAGNEAVRTYHIALGRGGLDPKRFQGDKRTPEGKYVVDFRNERSGYHKAMHISYPSPDDVKNAADAGKDPGGDIMIHGIRNGMGWVGPLHRLIDWTAGCIAVTDDEIDEMWPLVKDGIPVEIKP